MTTRPEDLVTRRTPPPTTRELARRIDALDNGVDNLEQRVTVNVVALAATLGELNRRLDRLEHQVAKLIERTREEAVA